jgi:hypothetical protein
VVKCFLCGAFQLVLNLLGGGQPQQLSHLTGRAEAWPMAEWDLNSPVCLSQEMFTDTLRKIFDHTTPGHEAARALMCLHQGSCQVNSSS